MSNDNRQRSLFRGFGGNGPRPGRRMRGTVCKNTCKGCGFNRDGVCKILGVPIKDSDTCRAAMPPARRKRRKMRPRGRE